VEGDEPMLRTAKVDFCGVKRDVSLAFTPEVETGDYVLVHVGFALSRIDEEEAARVREAGVTDLTKKYTLEKSNSDRESAITEAKRNLSRHEWDLARGIGRGAIQLAAFLATPPGGQLDHESAAKEAQAWVETFKRQHLLLRGGPRSFVFLHSTIMEFLAAHHLASSQAQPDALAQRLEAAAKHGAPPAWKPMPTTWSVSRLKRRRTSGGRSPEPALSTRLSGRVAGQCYKELTCIGCVRPRAGWQPDTAAITFRRPM
jgi:hydrogenase expression/formation protein HypC